MVALYWQKIAHYCTGLVILTFTCSTFASEHINCDIRKLELTQMQKARLRLIRMQYKRNQNTNLQHTANSKRKNEQLNQILMQPKFDEAEAKRYILNHYMSRMQQDVNELKVQYEFLQVLNHQQRKNWINNCLR
jgi:Spy/CpxP family protein refolding chaperone